MASEASGWGRIPLARCSQFIRNAELDELETVLKDVESL